MEKLIQKWREFMEQWVPNNPAKDLDGNLIEGSYVRPRFDDFMGWLAFPPLSEKK